VCGGLVWFERINQVSPLVDSEVVACQLVLFRVLGNSVTGTGVYIVSSIAALYRVGHP